MKILVSILFAAIPAFIWMRIFYKKDQVFRSKAAQTFLLGMASVLPILLYKWSWQYFPQINIFNYTNNFETDLLSFTPNLFLPIGTVIAFMFVGVIEEYMKNVVVRKVDRGFFRNIDDCIEFAILSALGFAFIENVMYFYYIWEYQGLDILLVSFVFRAVFSTFAHILFSGIYGYFYGMAYFADPIWSEKLRKNRHPLIDLFHRVMHFKRNRIFATEKITEGLFLAVALHAVFNILLELQLTFFMVPFLVLGYSYLDHLFKEKENLKRYGLLTGEEPNGHFHNHVWELFRRPKLHHGKQHVVRVQ